eukprot:15282440-Alexandrium_andersonii.AAC.1
MRRRRPRWLPCAAALQASLGAALGKEVPRLAAVVLHEAAGGVVGGTAEQSWARGRGAARRAPRPRGQNDGWGSRGAAR